MNFIKLDKKDNSCLRLNDQITDKILIITIKTNQYKDIIFTKNKEIKLKIMILPNKTYCTLQRCKRQ